MKPLSGLGVIFRREFLERIRNKTYLITTLIGIIVIIGLSFTPMILDKIKSADRTNIMVLEQSGEISTFLDQQLQDKLPDGEREFSFQSVKPSLVEWEDQKNKAIKAMVDDGDISAVLEVSPPNAPSQLIWHTKNMMGSDASAKVRDVIQQMTVQERVAASGFSSGQFEALFAPIDFQIQTEGLKGGTQDQQTQNIMLVYFLLFMLYFSLIVYGMYVASGVIEEKSSRVMEMMLATVKPTTMMAGKILGIGAAGLTQYFIWIASGIGLIALKGKSLSVIPGASFEISTVDPAFLIYFGVFFILGFLLYASLYAGIGSMVSRVEDTNQAVSPLTFLTVVGFMLAMFSLTAPDNPWIVGLSYVPFFTPMLLFSRIILTQVPPLSIAIGIAELIASIALLIWLAGKMYRVGVLVYGKMSWRDIFRALRQK